MTQEGPAITQQDLQTLRDGAAKLVERLGLSGYDNASILRADAFVDSTEFREAMASGGASLAYEVGAYLGEAIIRRHGGKWTLTPNGPRIHIKRNGVHLVDPFGKVQKRAQNGEVDQLLALVNLVEHVASKPKGPAVAALAAPNVALAATGAAPAASPGASGGMSAARFLVYALVALVLLPLVTVVLLVTLSDPTYALIGAVASVPVGLVLLVLFARYRDRQRFTARGA
jgi:hypothetical protein